MERRLSDALKCKACDAPIKEHKLDTELCHVCLSAVYFQLQDLDNANPEDFQLAIFSMAELERLCGWDEEEAIERSL